MSELTSTPISIALAGRSPFRLGPVEVRPATLELLSGDRREQLEPRVMQVLVALAERPGEVVSREALNQACWGGRIVGDDAINRCMVRLRRLSEVFGGFRIETIPRVGYRLTPAGEAAAPRDRPVARRPRWIAGLAATLLVGVMALAGFGYDRWATQEAIANPQVLVRPFKALSEDPMARTVAQAAAEEVTGALSESRVRVISKPGLFRRGLYEVDGAVVPAGERLHVQARIRDAGSGVVLWSVEFDQAKARSQDLAADVAWRVASALSVAVFVQRNNGALVDPVALGFHLKARDAAGTPDAAAMEEAVRRAPKVGWMHFSRAIHLLGRAGTAPPREFAAFRDEALAEAKTAQRLNPRIPSHLIQVAVMPARQWTRYEAILHRGLASAPSPMSYSWMSSFLRQTGRVREAAQMFERMEAPARFWTGHARAWPYTLYLTGNAEAANAEAKRALGSRPEDRGVRATALTLAVMSAPPAEARALLDDPTRRPELTPLQLAAYQAYVEARATGDPGGRARAAQAVFAASRARQMFPIDAAPMLAAMGDLDHAFLMAQAYLTSPRASAFANVYDTSFLFGPDAAAMRADSRFIPLVEQAGLADYWRRSGQWPDFCATEPASVCSALKASRSALR